MDLPKKKLTFGDRQSNPRQSRLPVVEQRRSTRSSSQQSYNRNSSARKNSYGGDLAAGPSSALRRHGSEHALSTPSHFMTPAHRSPISLRKMTLTAEQARRACDEGAVKILTILQQDREFWTELKLNNGLKGMTAKQFIEIILYLAEFIAGKKLIAANSKIEPYDDIIQFLKNIKCPYMVTKSILKTPNAPHSFDQSVTLLDWLCDFVGTGNATEAEDAATDIQYIHDGAFPNIEFSKIFSVGVSAGFKSWSEEDPKFDDLKRKLIDGYVSAHMQNRVRSVAELQNMIESTKQRSEALKKLPSTIKNENKFQSVESQFLKYEELESKLEQNIERENDRLASVELEWNEKNRLVKNKEEKISMLKATIENQRINNAEFKDLLEKRSNMKNKLENLRRNIEENKDEDAVKQIQYARLIQNKYVLLNTLNKQITKVLEIVVRSQPKLIDDCNLYNVNPGYTVDEIKTVKTRVNDLLFHVREVKDKCAGKIYKTVYESDGLRKNEIALLTKKKKSQDKYQKLNSSVMRVNESLVMNSIQLKSECEEIEKLVKEAHLLRSELETDVKTKEEKYIQLERENEQIWEEGERKCLELLEEKQRIIDNLDAAIALVDQLTGQGDGDDESHLHEDDADDENDSDTENSGDDAGDDDIAGSRGEGEDEGA